MIVKTLIQITIILYLVTFSIPRANSESMNFANARDVLSKIQNEPLRDAILESRSQLATFKQAFQNQTRAMSTFVVSGMQQTKERLVPLGVIVHSIDGNLFKGVRLDNAPTPGQEVLIEIDESEIIDWYFVELREMQGGLLWKTVYNSLSNPRKTVARNAFSRICCIDSPKRKRSIIGESWTL